MSDTEVPSSTERFTATLDNLMTRYSVAWAKFGGGSLPWRVAVVDQSAETAKTPHDPDCDCRICAYGGREFLPRRVPTGCTPNCSSRICRPTTVGVSLICVLLTGCQFVIYQHNDYRQTTATAPQSSGTAPSRSANVFPGLFGLSPGLNALADAWAASGNGRVWTGHSAGGKRIESLLNSPPYGSNSPLYGPDTVVLVEPWPLRLDLSNAPACVKRIVVVSARPCEVVPPPGVTVEYRRRPLAMLPVDLTVGHVVACGWAEAMP